MKKKDRFTLKNNGKLYEVSGYWCGNVVLTALDEKDEACLVYSVAEVRELLLPVKKDTPSAGNKSLKPAAVLIGENGNIFNLMGIAARVLKEAGMQDQAEEMVAKVTSSQSYDEALRVLMEYVEIE